MNGGPRIVATRAAAVGLAGALLVIVAFVFDAAPLFVPGLAFLVIGAGSPAWVAMTARGARARRVLVAERVIEDEPLQARIEVTRGRLGLPGAEVVDPFTGSRLAVSGAIALLGGERSASVSVVTRFARRGLHELVPPLLIVADPLDLTRARVQSADAPQQLLVLPRVEPVRWVRSGRARRMEMPDGRASSDAMAAVDLDGLRPYRAGTPASRIHWPAVARGAGLLERRLLADGDNRPLVILDARHGERDPPELLDAAVRAAGSLALELARGGGCGLLLPGEQRTTAIDRELSAWPAAHARLAMVVGGPSVRAPTLGPSAGRLGPMIYVAAAPVERLSSILSVPGGGAVVLVVPVRGLTGGRPRGMRGVLRVVLEVSGCRGFRLGAGRMAARDRAERHGQEPTAV